MSTNIPVNHFGPGGRGFRSPRASNRAIGEYGGGGFNPGGWQERPFGMRDDFNSNWLPDWDVYNADDAVIVTMEVPGIKKEELKIDVAENRLIIQSKRNFDERLRDADNVYLREREFGFFKRRVRLPEGCDVSKITAKLLDGILTVRIPKGEGTPGVRVKIE
ncbi:1695_t:CDS:2 [Diversispora eburnea]|uniref:1695_t:CDS:1 n=1 Tax=Diversispora eburnea TaxID=1213867 RepID=A0A9N8W4G2_9GLOM|nr:1695_t:CDS:2 [Diversispora eburnea]